MKFPDALPPLEILRAVLRQNLKERVPNLRMTRCLGTYSTFGPQAEVAATKSLGHTVDNPQLANDFFPSSVEENKRFYSDDPPKTKGLMIRLVQIANNLFPQMKDRKLALYSHFGIQGHTVYNCYKPHGYPQLTDACRPDGFFQVTNHGVSVEAVKEFPYSQCAVKEKLLYSDDHSKTMGLEQLTTGQTFGTSDPQPGGSSVSNFSGIVSLYSVFGPFSIPSTVWILDSGATHHVCCSPTAFLSQTSAGNCLITTADGHTVSVLGTGAVHLSDDLTLENVLYVPEFHCNVLSISALFQQHPYSVSFYHDHCVIEDPTQGRRIGMGRQVGNLYILDLSKTFFVSP